MGPDLQNTASSEGQSQFSTALRHLVLLSNSPNQGQTRILYWQYKTQTLTLILLLHSHGLRHGPWWQHDPDIMTSVPPLHSTFIIPFLSLFPTTPLNILVALETSVCHLTTPSHLPNNHHFFLNSCSRQLCMQTFTALQLSHWSGSRFPVSEAPQILDHCRDCSHASCRCPELVGQCS